MKIVMKKEKMINSFRQAIILGMTALMVVSCNDDDDDNDTPGSDFDRKAMLTDLGNELIIPNFEELQASVNALSQAADDFTQNTTEENLQSMRSAWREAVIDHQHCSAFGFGPGELLLGPYPTVLAVFPVDENQVEANILNPNFDLPNSFDRDVRGFYTVEYLIYGDDESDAEIVNGFDQNRKDYLLLIVAELKNNFDQIVAEWNGSYFEEFVNSEGTSAGSSVSQLYNSFVRDYENLKNFKVELPAGLTAGQPNPDGTLVEAYYSGISTELIEEHWESSKNIWYGRTRSAEDLIGFEEYLASVMGGPALIETTKAAIVDINLEIMELPDGPLSENVDSPELVTLRDELQANTANFKSSMSSLLGISITFSSGDGD
jgi:predicted lipoprotein